ncbi:MAG TPA: VOC family protein [Candidatus Acidoferrum sp.]|nr:VOC family protein [Candidatus Acidoferrum sp.]
MKAKFVTVFVADQQKALEFYTNILGFEKKVDMPLGEFRWLTVVSPEGPAEIEVLLEPMAFPPARVFQKALYDAGVPLTAFTVSDIEKEHERLTKLGVVFKEMPKQMGPVKIARFDDTCGNYIQLLQPPGA